jgi:type VI secretion system protein ImpG
LFNHYYQEELAFLRELGREFSAAHPDAAHFLAERGSDPDVERLLEGFAFLTGRLRQKLDDELPELTHSLLGLLWPHYLRPLPGATIVQFTPLPGAVREHQTIARGTQLDAVPVEGTACRFCTTSVVTLDPLTVQEAALELVPGGGSLLRLSLVTSSGVKVPQLRLGSLRVHLTGDPALVSALFVLLDRHVEDVTVQSVLGKQPLASYRLPGSAVTMVGMDKEDALLPHPATSLPGYRLLLEYFTFPAKFHFFEIKGLERVTDLGGDTRLDLVFRFRRQPPSVLRVEAENFQLGCTPAINLFARDAQPISVEHDKTEYLVRAQGGDPAHYEVFSVDSVVGFAQGTVETRTYPAFISFLHSGQAVGKGDVLYHHQRLKPAVVGDGTETYLSFFSASGENLLPPTETISVRLTCTNRRLVRGLRVGDVSVPTADTPEFARFRNITGVSGSAPPPLGGELTWRMISHLSLNYLSLSRPESLRSLLGLYNFQALHDAQAARANELRLESIQSVTAEADDALLRGAPVRGMHTTIELSDEKFAGEGDLVLFCEILNEFLALYASLNSFSKLTVKGSRSGEVYKWPPRLGRQNIL